MDKLKPKVIFEHPLNEKMRMWLRIEFLIKQLEHNKVFNQNNALLFFHLLSELLEIVERNDIRSDLIKDLTEQKQKLSVWHNVSGVDTTLLHALLDKLDHITSELISNPKLGQDLKENRFISSIRKRLTIPGGCCSFDLPSFHLWLHTDQAHRDHQVTSWLDSFSSLYQTISTYMQLIRQTSRFKRFSCSNNFYQHTNEAIRLLRIKIPFAKGIFPQVSGNAIRYAIRFIPLELVADSVDNNSVDSSNIEGVNIEFELACC